MIRGTERRVPHEVRWTEPKATRGGGVSREVWVDGLRLLVTVDPASFRSKGTRESLVTALDTHSEYVERKLSGPRTGIMAFDLGDTVVNDAGERRVVHIVDRSAGTIGFAGEKKARSPAAAWRPEWTFPPRAKEPA